MPTMIQIFEFTRGEAELPPYTKEMAFLVFILGNNEYI